MLSQWTCLRSHLSLWLCCNWRPLHCCYPNERTCDLTPPRAKHCQTSFSALRYNTFHYNVSFFFYGGGGRFWKWLRWRSRKLYVRLRVLKSKTQKMFHSAPIALLWTHAQREKCERVSLKSCPRAAAETAVTATAITFTLTTTIAGH